MARTPDTPQEADVRVAPAETDSKLFASLLALHSKVDAASEGQPARVQAALQAIAGGINTLENSIRTDANLERD